MLRRLRQLLSVLVLAFAGCVGTNQSASDLLSCKGGSMTLTPSSFESTANANRNTLTTTKVLTGPNTSSGVGMTITSSECPVPVTDALRTVTISLFEHPTIGKTYTLSTPGTTSGSYLDYSEMGINLSSGTRTNRSWIASGSLTVSSISGSSITLSGSNLVMTRRADESANTAQGSFRLDVTIRADNVAGL